MNRVIGRAVHDAARRLDEAGVSYGHGTLDATQEAMWLATHVLGMPWKALADAADEPISAANEAALIALVDRRIASRKPAAYLLNEAWLGPHRFYVDERVIVPRSFIAELLRSPSPSGAQGVERGVGEGRGEGGATVSLPVTLGEGRGEGLILDLCTGSGCLAILAALAWPGAKVDAVDLSAGALEVARRNVDDYRLQERVRLLQSDMFDAVAGRSYDLIIANPPYVKAAAMKKLPEEYRREPAIALASGTDGLDHTRTILAQARHHLNPGGLLAVEIGHNRKALERAFPALPFGWPKTSGGRNFVFTLPAEALA